MNYMSWNELLVIIVLSGWDQSLKHMVFLWGHFNLCTFVFSVKMRECRVWKAKEQSCDDVTANKKVQRRKCKGTKLAYDQFSQSTCTISCQYIETSFFEFNFMCS